MPKKIVPHSSGEEGNTLQLLPTLKKENEDKPKQIPARRNHFFTFFYDKTIANKEYFRSIMLDLKVFAQKGQMQTEICPTTGRPHLQGMIWCKDKVRDTAFKKLRGANFRNLKDILNEAEYCIKSETHDGLFRCSWGFPQERYVQHIANLYDWEIEILALLETEPVDRIIHWYWESDGCKGKTTFQKYIFTHFDGVCIIDGKGADMKNAIVTHHAKTKELPTIILIDIPKNDSINLCYTGLEQVKNMFFHSGKYEGGQVCGRCPHVLIFSNEEVNYSAMTNNRFVCKNLKDCIATGEPSNNP